MSNQSSGAVNDRISTAVIVAWTLVTLTSFFLPDVLSANHARFVNVVLLSVFTLVHGARRYGAVGIFCYFVIAVVVTNITENLSIVTGFPFGQYHHTAAMGPKLWHVPLIVGPIFAVAGYLAWVITGIFLREVFTTTVYAANLARPLLAALLTTSWDLCVDAIGGSVNRDWVWADGGPWFGVPWLNFFGWVLTMWVIFQLFSSYLTRYGTLQNIPASSHYWTQPIVYWLLIALQFPLLTFLIPNAEVTDPAGHVWHLPHLFESMALVSVFTMMFAALLAYSVLYRERQTAQGTD